MFTSRNRLAVIYLLLAACICLPMHEAAGQEDRGPASSDTENQAVFRISQSFLAAEAESRPLEANIPFCASILKFLCRGTISCQGTLDVSLLDNGRQAVFEVTGKGDGFACVRGVRGPVVANGSAGGPFTSVARVAFDGRRFSQLSTTTEEKLCVDVRSISGPLERRMGRFLGSAALPLAEHLLPRAVVEATPVAKRYLEVFIDTTAERIIDRLNAKTPVEETLARVLPQARDWRFQMSSAGGFLQAAYGPTEAAVPVLPVLPVTNQDVWPEVWLSSTTEKAALLAKLSRQPLAELLVQQLLESKLPELAAVAAKRRVDAVGSWVVVRVGT